MILFLKGLLIGIAKIIPGVSGAVMAMLFDVYEPAIMAITSFFDNWKRNLKFLFLLGSGIILSIILGSKIIVYLLDRYYFFTMCFFIGLIIGGTYKFFKKNKLNIKNLFIVILTCIFFLMLMINIKNNVYILKNNVNDYLFYFLSGFIDAFSSIVPGISGTALLMFIGMYNNVLILYSSLYDLMYVLNHIDLYICYFLGIAISFFLFTYLIKYMLKKWHDITYSIIFGLCIVSIIMLIKLLLSSVFTIFELLGGIIIFLGGIILSKKI